MPNKPCKSRADVPVWRSGILGFAVHSGAVDGRDTLVPRMFCVTISPVRRLDCVSFPSQLLIICNNRRPASMVRLWKLSAVARCGSCCRTLRIMLSLDDGGRITVIAWCAPAGCRIHFVIHHHNHHAEVVHATSASAPAHLDSHRSTLILTR